MLEKIRDSLKNKWVIWGCVACLSVLVLLIYVKIHSLVGTVNEKTVTNILKDIYTPSDVKYYNSRSKYYVDKKLMTLNEANELFKPVDKLTEDDLSRSIDIIKVDHSSSKNNSYGDELYKVSFSVVYKGDASNLEVLFFVNGDGSIYNHEISGDN